MTSPTLKFRSIIPYMRGEGGFAFIARGRELASKGHHVVNLSIGQPDVPTPDNVIESAVHWLRDKKYTAYTETPGIPELRQAVADYLNERYGSDVDWREVVVTPGTKGAIFLSLATYLDPGDEIIVPEPSYPAYPEGAKILNAKARFVPLRFEGSDKGFKLDMEAIEEAITPKTKMIVVNNPHNPSGAVFTPREIDELVDIAREHKIMILADEIYDNYVYDGSFKSLISYPDWREFLVYTNGFSKTFSMTGWRLGYIVVRREVAEILSKLAVNIWGCPTSFAQKAAVTALKDPDTWKWVEKISKRYAEMRTLLYNELQGIEGVEAWKSRGAFYLFPRISSLLNKVNMNVDEFVNYIIDNYYLIILPGTAFPDTAGKDYVRFSFATSREAILEGAKRFREAVEDLLSKQS
ncbi:pyridoxal phosphate-dependent aminotransferase [Staphylothermus hellenicus]|uniref:Aminotransferase n=1 Tax=Staphylothermus hellenicus (strain DSM 12710 / JCM 10830 / BK20S6-10-b1 / P8) TaxID=591019 RepID=D7DBX2_STAHD|nr:pyridoxal phosphate-dependent aminotransferase [Staphylothermus hellenicus]ADI31669.1 aminotransferase class I and II [Staphylothermus hellenicus DSM 12710]